MADYILDTSAVSDLIQAKRQILSRLTQLLPAGRVFISPTIREEVLFGLERMPMGRPRDLLAEKISQTLANLFCEPIPETAGDHYARIKWEARRKGLSLDENDLWIAATAAALDAILVTRDRDFGRVRELLVENWT